jgi:hypothetical protein
VKNAFLIFIVSPGMNAKVIDVSGSDMNVRMILAVLRTGCAMINVMSVCLDVGITITVVKQPLIVARQQADVKNAGRVRTVKYGRNAMKNTSVSHVAECRNAKRAIRKAGIGAVMECGLKWNVMAPKNVWVMRNARMVSVWIRNGNAGIIRNAPLAISVMDQADARSSDAERMKNARRDKAVT